MNKFILLLLLFNIFSFVVKSQDFEVAPVKMEFVVNPDESQTKLLSIKNHANFKTSFTISFADFIVNKNGSKEARKKNSTKTSCAEWITPEKTFFDINPNEQVQIKITMHPPADDYTTRWALMYIQTVKEQTSFDVDKSSIGAGISLSGRISVEVYRKPKTPIKPNLTIKNLREKVNTEDKKRTFVADIVNSGDIIANCKIMFIASDLNTAEEIEFDPIHLTSYPNFTREVEFTLPETMPPGKYSFAALLDYGKTTTIKETRLKKTLLILPKENGNK